MAKRLLKNYTFDPATGTIAVLNNYSLNELLVITNVTDNVIIYNFADATKGATTSYSSSTDKTTITLTYNTSTMSSTDVLQIYVDSGEHQIQPYGAYSDPVDKMRVSNPQSLIDTDFEYSLQPTKWETTLLQNNIPGIYQKANEPAFTAEQITSILPFTIESDPIVTGITYQTSLEGLAYTTIENRGDPDSNDTSAATNSTLPFTFTVGNYSFNQVRANSEGIVFFGSTSTAATAGLGTATYFGTPHLHVWSENMWVARYDSRIEGTAPNRRFIFRYTGTSTAQENNDRDRRSKIAYIIFNEDNTLEVHYQSNDANAAGPLGSIGVSNGTEFIATWTPSESSTAANFNTRDAFKVDLNTQVVNGLAVTVNQAPVEAFYVGQPVIFKETKNTLNLDKGFLIASVLSTTSFFVVPNQDITFVGEQKTDYTVIYTGGFYFSSEIPFTSVTRVSGSRNIKITFSSAHSLFVGSKIYVVDENITAIDWIGAFVVNKVLSSTEIEYTALTNANYGDSSTLSTATTKIYVRNDGTAQHRFFDGGVQINPEGTSPNCQIIRQTRNYFRYQSGKGIQFSTGVLFKPTYDVFSVSVSADAYDASTNQKYLMTIETENLHGFALPDDYRAGAVINLYNFEVSSGTNPYNITEATINSVIDGKRFTVEIPVNPASLPTDLSPGGLSKVEVSDWKDATVRSGLFDDQNGIYFEHDGDELYAVLRNSTEQISGFSSVTNGSSSVTGTNTKYKTQLNEGDYIVLKGKSYIVTNIVSNTSMIITPEYNGETTTAIKIVKTNEQRIKRTEFNIDYLDGTGPSKYVYNANKMQMVFLDYSWYGAGKIRFGMRGYDGRVYYCHEIVNNNVNTEAYMRTGNIPGRFEIQTKSKIGKIKSALTALSTTLSLDETEAVLLPSQGRIIINNEYIEYTKGSTAAGLTTINLVNRNVYGLTGGNATADINDGWISFNQNCSPSLSHWGVSVIMDGQFNQDKSYLFSAINDSLVSVGAGATVPILTIRLAPSVDYGISGFYGVRSLINRSVLTLKTIGLVTAGQMTISVKINGESTTFGTNTNWLPAGNGSIAQYIDHSSTGGTVTGGDLVALFLTDEGSNRASSSTFDISDIRDLGNSVLGGPNTYPDGPDTLTIFATNNVGQSQNIRARISWTEAQG